MHEFYSAWQDAGELENVLDSLKWVTDYLIKCHPDPDTYYVQVRKGNEKKASLPPSLPPFLPCLGGQR